MEKHDDIDQAAREWFVLRLEEARGEALRGRVECTADSERRSFGSGEELLEILRAVAEAGKGAASREAPEKSVSPAPTIHAGPGLALEPSQGE